MAAWAFIAFILLADARAIKKDKPVVAWILAHIAGGGLMFAIWIGSTRITDYWHHTVRTCCFVRLKLQHPVFPPRLLPNRSLILLCFLSQSDVVTGLILGAAVAFAVYSTLVDTAWKKAPKQDTLLEKEYDQV